MREMMWILGFRELEVEVEIEIEIEIETWNIVSFVELLRFSYFGELNPNISIPHRLIHIEMYRISRSLVERLSCGVILRFGNFKLHFYFVYYAMLRYAMGF